MSAAPAHRYCGPEGMAAAHFLAPHVVAPLVTEMLAIEPKGRG